MNERLEYFLYRFLFIVRSSDINASNTRRFLSNKKPIIAATCCLCIATFIVYHSHSSKVKNSPSLRATIINSPLYEEKLQTIGVSSTIKAAEDEVLNKANDELSIMEEDIDMAEENLLERMTKSLDTFLIDEKKLSAPRVKEVEEKIYKGLDDKVSSLMYYKINEIESAANEDLDILDDEALKGKPNDIDSTNDLSKVNQPRLDHLKESLEEYLKKEITDSENEVMQSLGKVAEDIETKVFREEGIRVSDNELAALIEEETKNIKKSGPTASINEDLEIKEAGSVITKAEDEVLESANDEVSVMEKDVIAAEENLREIMAQSLDKFLINEKKLSTSQAREVEKKVLNAMDDKVLSLVEKEEADLEVMANDNLDKLDVEALKSKSDDMDSTIVNQPKLDNLKEGLETFLKEEIDESEERLIQSLGKVTEDIETKIFKEEGIDVSANELAALVEQETNNIKKSEPLVGLETKDKEVDSEILESIIKKAEEEVLDAANDEISVVEKDATTAEGNLQEKIQKSLDDFLLKDKKLSFSKAIEVEDKIHERVDDRFSSLLDSKTDELEIIANDNLDKLDVEVLKSKLDDTNGNSEVKVNQPELDYLKGDLENYLKNQIDESEKQLIQSLGDVTKDVETEVFKEEGIDVSDEEVAALVTQETKNIIKAEQSV